MFVRSFVHSFVRSFVRLFVCLFVCFVFCLKDDSNLTSLEDDPQTLQILEVKKHVSKEMLHNFSLQPTYLANLPHVFPPVFLSLSKVRLLGGVFISPSENGAPELGLVVEPTPKTRKICAVVKLDHPPRDQGEKKKPFKPPLTTR